MKIKQQIRLFSLFIVLLSLVAVTGSVFASRFNKYQPDPYLTRLALQAADFPEGSESQESGTLAKSDMSHPLNTKTSLTEKAPIVSEYQTGYKSVGIVPSGDGVVYVGNYLYTYATAEQAKIVTTVMSEDVANSGGTNLDTIPPGAKSGISGQTIAIASEQGDMTYWFIGVKENVLILLVVNGLPEPNSAIHETFSMYLEKLVE